MFIYIYIIKNTLTSLKNKNTRHSQNLSLPKSVAMAAPLLAKALIGAPEIQQLKLFFARHGAAPAVAVGILTVVLTALVVVDGLMVKTNPSAPCMIYLPTFGPFNMYRCR